MPQPDEHERFNEAVRKQASQLVFDGFITKLPGKAWALTRVLLKKYEIRGGAQIMRPSRRDTVDS
jgi:hypothetical protein